MPREKYSLQQLATMATEEEA